MGSEIHLNVDWDALHQAVDEIVEEAIGEGVDVAANQLRNQIPASRRETQRSVIAGSNGNEGHYGVLFPVGKRYDKRGTQTEKIVTEALDRIEQSVVDTVELSIQEGLEELES